MLNFFRENPAFINAIVFLGLLVALILNWSWPWGVLFLYWTIPAIRGRVTILVSEINRDDQRVLFWAVTILWILIGILMILTDLTPALVNQFYAGIGGAG